MGVNKALNKIKMNLNKTKISNKTCGLKSWIGKNHLFDYLKTNGT